MSNKGWHEHSGLAVAMPVDNIDTDQIIPARFMSRTRAEGYGDVLFNDLRTSSSNSSAGSMHSGNTHSGNKHSGNTELGNSRQERFILDRHPAASILVAGHNFGSGSSREAAVYALVDAGFKTIIAPGFGDIFSANAVNNGLLPAQVDVNVFELLVSHLQDSARSVHISLHNKSIAVAEHSLAFRLDNTFREKLINGWDDIDLTQVHQQAIADFSSARRRDAPWAWPGNPSGK